jgi:hypothetical protein
MPFIEAEKSWASSVLFVQLSSIMDDLEAANTKGGGIELLV